MIPLIPLIFGGGLVAVGHATQKKVTRRIVSQEIERKKAILLARTMLASAKRDRRP